MRFLVLGLLVLLQACASVPNLNPDPRDPWESLNRNVYGLNDALDRSVLRPVAIAYRDGLPYWVRKGVSNFFGNLSDVWSGFNHAITLEGRAAKDSFGRVIINSTAGVLGVIDVATDLNLEKNPADFGVTLGRWGVSPGPYVVLPLLGPYTLREVVVLPLDRQANLVNQIGNENLRTSLTVLNFVDDRAIYLKVTDVMDGAALDPYSFTRDAYLQRQRYRQFNGNPPEEIVVKP